MIRTFVFLDLETSGFITKSSFPKITELSLLAVSRDAIRMEAIPRVQHKLVLPINPMIQLSQKITSITGLSNANLENASPFENATLNLMNGFLRLLATPVCFVAHNGNQFDYPILLSEIQRIHGDFTNDVLSVDSLVFFKHLYEDAPAKLTHFLDDGCDDVLCSALDSVMTSYSNQKTESQPPRTPSPQTSDVDRVVDSLGMSSDFREMQKVNEKTPESQMVQSRIACAKFQGVEAFPAKRKLAFLERPANYKLGTIYQHIFNANPTSQHTAEGDCLTLLHCAGQLNSFLEWADNNAVPLNSHSRSDI